MAGRTLDEEQGGTMLLMILISGHTPHSRTRLTLGPFHSNTLTRLTLTKGLNHGRGMLATSPFSPSGGGAV